MKLVVLSISFVLMASYSFAQSGRRVKSSAPPASTAAPEQKPAVPVASPAGPKMAVVTAEKNQDYRCTSDGTLALVLESNDNEKSYEPKEVDTKAVITARPEPKYTREARRLGVQGNVILKLLLLAKGDIDRIRVVRPLPFGLTENAINSACQIKFQPAMKDGVAVSQWMTVEYGFRLARSSIFGP
jgi:periplasmic protein TonB